MLKVRSSAHRRSREMLPSKSEFRRRSRPWLGKQSTAARTCSPTYKRVRRFVSGRRPGRPEMVARGKRIFTPALDGDGRSGSAGTDTQGLWRADYRTDDCPAKGANTF